MANRVCSVCPDEEGKLDKKVFCDELNREMLAHTHNVCNVKSSTMETDTEVICMKNMKQQQTSCELKPTIDSDDDIPLNELKREKVDGANNEPSGLQIKHIKIEPVCEVETSGSNVEHDDETNDVSYPIMVDTASVVKSENIMDEIDMGVKVKHIPYENTESASSVVKSENIMDEIDMGVEVKHIPYENTETANSVVKSENIMDEIGMEVEVKHIPYENTETASSVVKSENIRDEIDIEVEVKHIPYENIETASSGTSAIKQEKDQDENKYALPPPFFKSEKVDDDFVDEDSDIKHLYKISDDESNVCLSNVKNKKDPVKHTISPKNVKTSDQDEQDSSGNEYLVVREPKTKNKRKTRKYKKKLKDYDFPTDYFDASMDMMVCEPDAKKVKRMVKERKLKEKKLMQLRIQQQMSGDLIPVKKESEESETSDGDDPDVSPILKKIRVNTYKLIINSNLCVFNYVDSKFVCYICSESFSDVDGLREHSRIHQDPNIIKKKCRELAINCFMNVDVTDLRCKICSEMCYDLEVLHFHLSCEHGFKFGKGEKKEVQYLLLPYKLKDMSNCVLCNEKIIDLDKMCEHVVNSHSTYVCDICGTSYSKPIELSSHKEMDHTAERNENNISGLSKRDLKNHCSLCNITFLQFHALVYHKMQQHGMENPLICCKLCARLFSSPANLKVHVRKFHYDEKNYSCDHCTSAFFSRSERDRHAKIHEGNSVLSTCEKCGKAYKNKSALQRHINNIHGFVIKF